MNQTLGRNQRIRKKQEFKLLFDEGKTARGRLFMIWALEKKPSGLSSCGFMVSRKTDVRAVGRNLWKRRMREAFRRNQHSFKPGIAVLFKAKGGMKAPPYREIEKELKMLLGKLNLLK